MISDNFKINELEQSILWPCDLSLDFKRSLLKLATIQTRKQGYYFLSSKDTSDGLYYILSGSLIMSIRTKDFHHFTHNLIGQNEFLYYGSLMENKVQDSLSAEMLQDTLMLKISEQDIQTLEKEQPEFYKFMFSLLKKRTLPLIQKGLLNQKFSIDIKVAFMLLEVASKQTSVQGSVMLLNITQQQLGDIADVTRQRVNAVLKQFQQQQIVELDRGKIYLYKPRMLMDLLKKENLSFYMPTINKE